MLALACSPPMPGPAVGREAAGNDDGGTDTSERDSGGSDTGEGDSGGSDTSGTQVWACPETTHDPAVGVNEDDYESYPVVIVGGDRRFLTIQDAIWGAEELDVVQVCPGLYYERIDFRGKSITVRSAEGPAVTILDGQQGGATVVMKRYEPPETVLEGFTIRGGSGEAGHGAGVFIEWGSPVVRYNIVTGNQSMIGAGVYARNAGPTVHNNIITANHAEEGGGGFVCTACRGSLRFNTIYNNTSREGPVMEYFWGAADIIGNILVAEEGTTDAAVRVTQVREDVIPTIAWNLLWPDTMPWVPSVWEGEFPGGEDWLIADPKLADPDGGDWSLLPSSPAVDAGPPDETDPDGTRADLGAFGGPDGSWPW
jgi:hypothetical protein